MPNLTKCQEFWLHKTDSAGNQVKQWSRATLHLIKPFAFCAASQYSAVIQDLNNSFVMLKEKGILI
jgi:hypothetical protein